MTELKRRIFSVSEFSGELSKKIAEIFPSVCIRGEVTNLSKPRSGHWYFALKDEDNQLRAVMFRSSNIRAPQIKDGDEIIACGKPTIYRERGDLQIVVSHIQSAGEGELQRRFELLRQELFEAGYFEQSRKKPIPVYPTRVAIITSSSGAVIHDIQTVSARRAPALPLLLFPSEVQGENAINSLSAALKMADSREDIDLIIIARGGGSLEDFAKGKMLTPIWLAVDSITGNKRTAAAILLTSAVSSEPTTNKATSAANGDPCDKAMAPCASAVANPVF